MRVSIKRFADLFPRAVAVAQRIVVGHALAEDVAAEAFARAFSRWPVVGRLEYREAWILRVVTNLALYVQKRRPRLLGASPAVDAEESQRSEWPSRTPCVRFRSGSDRSLPCVISPD